MVMNRKVFFDNVRGPLFGGSLDQRQVDGMGAILDEWESSMSGDDPRWLSYALATTYREAGPEMWPIREWGLGAGHPYGHPDPTTGQTYYGRGFVQLTWLSNYRRMGLILGVDLVNNPDLALQPDIAAKILLIGMQRGVFTGRNFGTYFNVRVDDPVNARRIINGLDHAELVASYYEKFLPAVRAALS